MLVAFYFNDFVINRERRILETDIFSRTLQFFCNVRVLSWYVVCLSSSSVTWVYC